MSTKKIYPQTTRQVSTLWLPLLQTTTCCCIPPPATQWRLCIVLLLQPCYRNKHTRVLASTPPCLNAAIFRTLQTVHNLLHKWYNTNEIIEIASILTYNLGSDRVLISPARCVQTVLWICCMQLEEADLLWFTDSVHGMVQPILNDHWRRTSSTRHNNN